MSEVQGHGGGLVHRAALFWRGVELKTYTLYIHDDRYSVPSLDAVTVRDDQRALEVGRNRLTVSPHYRLIEVWEDDRFIDKFARP
ncbi:MAG TPA: hypothetical protein VHZ26_09880 [Caulobacteraceae bacterium]|jgi:hypothetical protein|nr:hypothetical protein [Caulobacteraceae bacterium]